MLIENTEDLAQNKLLLLYIIEKSAKPFAKDELVQFILEKNYMNYFLIQQYLGELLSSNFIELVQSDSKEVYIISQSGKETLSYFKDRISNTVKDDLKNQFGKKEKSDLIQTQVLCDFYEKENSQHVVNIKLVENDDTLFSLYLDVVTKKQAEVICEQWKNNTEYIYKNIIELLISKKQKD